MSSLTTNQMSDKEADGGVLDHSPPSREQVDADNNTNNWQYDAISNSDLTGEFTTITNVLDGHADGAGEQYYSPSRSTFQVVDIIDGPRSNDGSNLGSFDSYYHMQQNGPPIVPESQRDARQPEFMRMRYGWRGGGFTGSSLTDTVEKDENIEVERYREDASDSNTNDRASSLSSLTNDFFPKIDRSGGRFFSSSKSKQRPSQLETLQGSISPSSNDKSSSQSSKKMLKAFSPPRKKKNNLVHSSPWYVNRHHRDTPSPQHSSDQTPMTTHLPGEVLVSPSHKASESNPTPSVISSSSMSQYFSNELREIYNTNAYRSYRHHYDHALSSPRAKRIMISSVILAAIFAIVAIVAITLSARPQNQSRIDVSASGYYDTQQPVGLPEKCCVGVGTIIDEMDKNELIEANLQDRVESTTNDNSTAPSPTASPTQETLDWDYVIPILTPNPTPGAIEDSENSAAFPSSPKPTPGENSNGWRHSIVPSWILTGEKNIFDTPYPTLNPTRKPSRRPTKRPTRRPTRRPTKRPTRRPTKQPTTNKPTRFPTFPPTTSPPTSSSPTFKPTNASFDSSAPTTSNTGKPSGDAFTSMPTPSSTVLVSTSIL